MFMLVLLYLCTWSSFRHSCLAFLTSDHGLSRSAGMYMQEALELVCKRRKLPNPKDYALVLRLPNQNIIVPLDRTVASLQGNRELYLYKRSHLASLGLLSKEIRTTDPNGEFSRVAARAMTKLTEFHYSIYLQAYERYTRTAVFFCVGLYRCVQGNVHRRAFLFTP